MKRDFETAIVDIFSLGFLLCGLGVSGGGDFWFRFNITPKLHKIKKKEKKKIKETNNLNDMVFEANVLFLLSASVLYVEYTDEISSPASKESVENLKQDAWKHTHLREWIGQSQENLSNLYNTRANIKKDCSFFHSAEWELLKLGCPGWYLIGSAAEPGIPSGATMPEKALHAEHGVLLLLFIFSPFFFASSFMFSLAKVGNYCFFCLLLWQHCVRFFSKANV